MRLGPSPAILVLTWYLQSRSGAGLSPRLGPSPSTEGLTRSLIEGAGGTQHDGRDVPVTGGPT